jgi:spore coat protein CotF
VDWENMTEDELVAKRLELQAQKDALRDEMLAIGQVLGAKRRARKAAELAATMSDPQKRALLQVLQTEAVESTATVGTPGA